MSDPIVILSGPQEGPYLEAKLRNYVADCGIHVVQTRDALIEYTTSGAFAGHTRPRLIAFCTDVIVPATTLSVFTGGAYNFHPGPPDYPGSNAASFAIYDQCSTYGVTAHEMEVTVDSGAIVGFDGFVIPSGIRFMDLEILAYQNLLNLFDRLAAKLIDTERPLHRLDLKWGHNKRNRKDFERMKQVSETMDEDEIRLRWRAFG